MRQISKESGLYVTMSRDLLSFMMPLCCFVVLKIAKSSFDLAAIVIFDLSDFSIIFTTLT